MRLCDVVAASRLHGQRESRRSKGSGRHIGNEADDAADTHEELGLR